MKKISQLCIYLLIFVAFVSCKLLPSSNLKSNCFNFPAQQFTPSHHASLSVYAANQPAIDFELLTLNGTVVRLETLLKEKPVLIQFGSYTCNIFEGNIPSSIELARRYSDKVHFLVVYTIEAHPIKPDPSPYTGSVWMFEYSNYTQPLNYKERVAVASHLPSLGDQLLVVDSLTPNELNDPFWCTYGTNANGVLLINQEGTVVNSDTWFSAKKMEEAINNLIG